MTSQHDKAKRWRPRFSVRTLVVMVTMACCYAACWKETRRKGVADAYLFAANRLEEQGRKIAIDWRRFMPEFLNASAKAPFVVGMDEFRSSRKRYYYFWFFGYVAKLPFEFDISAKVPPKIAHDDFN